MRNKIKEALKQKYGTRANKELGQLQLGISDEVFERVAASVETFITDESGIDTFVKNESTLNLLKSYQSMSDKIRTLEKQTPTSSPQVEDPKPTTSPQPQPEDMANIIANAVSAAIKPISDELTKFKNEQTAKASKEAAKAQFFGNDYVKKYGDEGSDAWSVTMDIYKYNPEWTSEQIHQEAMNRFNKAVSRKGVDTSKPFSGEGGSLKADKDFSEMAKRLAEKGFLPKEKTD